MRTAFDPTIPRTFDIQPRLSDTELENFCFENDAARIERNSEGVIVVNAPAGVASSDGNGEISLQLRAWWKTHRRGLVGESSAGYYLPDGSMLSPDASYTTVEKLAALNPKERRGFPHACPDFVIELLSEADSLPATKRKMEKWLSNGAALAWLVNPRKKEVLVYEAGQAAPMVITELFVYGSGPVAGFTLDLAEVWQCYDL